MKKKDNHPFFMIKWLSFGWDGVKKMIIPKSLQQRFVLIILVPMLFLQAVFFVAFFERHWDTVGRRLAKDVSGEIVTVADMIEKTDLSNENIGLLIRSLGENLGFSLFFEAKASLKQNKPSLTGLSVKALIAELGQQPYPFLIQETENQKTEIMLQLSSGVLHAFVPKKRFFSSTIYVVLGWMIGFSLLLFIIAFVFMKNQVRSIERLSRAAELFGRGKTMKTFKPEGATEVRQAGLSFIQMQNRIQRYLSERTGMLSGVSHDLKTPLTRMKLQLSMAPQNEVVQDLQEDISEMEHMLEAYLSFARGEGKEQPEEVSLNELIDDVVSKLTKTGQKIDWHQETNILCIGRPNELVRAITNLLTNAGRYAKNARVQLGTYRQMARLIIDDDGPGIPINKREEVFRAFYRLEKSRNTHTGGVGLGMTIAKDIILSHGGEIELSDSPMGGLRITILVPLARHS